MGHTHTSAPLNAVFAHINHFSFLYHHFFPRFPTNLYPMPSSCIIFHLLNQTANYNYSNSCTVPTTTPKTTSNRLCLRICYLCVHYIHITTFFIIDKQLCPIGSSCVHMHILYTCIYKCTHICYRDTTVHSYYT